MSAINDFCFIHSGKKNVPEVNFGLSSIQSLYNPHVRVEFQSEIKIMAQVEHLNLVRFYGYLEQGDERVIVVEYVPNGTLRNHLDGM